ncbi:MAG: hypothetical protein ACI9OB_000414 [Nonlabens sp.]|jgi:hypothetical protein
MLSAENDDASAERIHETLAPAVGYPLTPDFHPNVKPGRAQAVAATSGAFLCGSQPIGVATGAGPIAIPPGPAANVVHGWTGTWPTPATE